MSPSSSVAIELCAVIVSVTEGAPRVVVAEPATLPSGPLQPQHRKLEQGVRDWVTSGTGLTLGYVEQLYTFADKDRGQRGTREISIGYLALAQDKAHDAVKTVSWYDFFPWEDHRAGPPEAVLKPLRKHLAAWKNAATTRAEKSERDARIAFAFPADARAWNEEMVLQRYELLWEAGLIEEATRHTRTKPPFSAGHSMMNDHRRILATAMARLRAKIKYRPVVFELLPPRFTLLQLQNTVEALAGLRLHKQNFRRLVQGQGLVEETAQTITLEKGRPAKLFAFRREVLRERAAVGTKLPRR